MADHDIATQSQPDNCGEGCYHSATLARSLTPERAERTASKIGGGFCSR